MPTAKVRTATFMNWVNVTLSWEGHDTVQVISVTGVSWKINGKVVKFYGDAAYIARVIASVEGERGVEISTGDAELAFTIPFDTPITVAATLLDPRNKAAANGGAIRVTLVNAIREGGGADGQNNQFAKGSLKFEAFAGVDPDTGALVDPMSYVRL